MGDARRVQRGNVDEDVLASVFDCDKAETLRLVEPLDLALERRRGRRVRGGPARRAGRVGKRAPRTLDCARRVDRYDPGNLRALRAGADDNPHLCARDDSIVSGRMKRSRVQEGVALSVGELDEAETLLLLEPFHDRID